MQKVIYECDNCSTLIGEVKHVTLGVASNGMLSGIAIPPGGNYAYWHVKPFPNKFIHLHIKCATSFFNKLSTSAK